MPAAFGDLEPGVGGTAREQAPLRGAGAKAEAFAEHVWPARKILCCQPEIDFGDLLLKIRDAVAADDAAADGDERTPLQPFGVAHGFEYGVYRLLHGRLDEAAGVDEDEVGPADVSAFGDAGTEAAAGVEIVVDDTPEAIVISGFDPVRREVCRLALHQLVSDGRIHPARIEEVVAKVKKQLDNEIIETGKRTAIDLGIHGLHPELIRIIGKMKYRSSYGQNLLQHARETANLCAVMAAELGLNPKKAKRAGLLHDIGKVPDEESEMPHALYGAKIAEQFKEKPDICNAIGAHHDEMEMQTLLAPIVQVCDAISGARPGARREIVEAYIKRLNDLEAIAMSYPGVTKTYAIQAGRELRVIVGADKMNDAEAEALSSDIATKIQNEMTYPGQVKITVIRETRSVAYAK